MSDKPLKDDQEYRQKLSIRITLATTALRHHRPNEPTQSKKPTDKTFRILQHITTLLATGTRRNVKGPANDPTAARVIALTANFQSDGIKSLVFVTQDTRHGLSPERAEIKSLESDLKGENVLRQWDPIFFTQRTTPEVHLKKLFAIIEMFRQIRANPSVSSVKLPTLIQTFHLYAVQDAYPKIAARILNGSNTWTEHPMDIFARDLGELFDRLAYPKILNIRHSMVREVLREGYDIDATPTESGHSLYTVTRSNIGDWVHAFTAIFEILKRALVEAGKCKTRVTRYDVTTATKHSIYLHELLRSGLVSFLLTDPLFSAKMATKRARGHGTIPLILETREEGKEEDEDEDDDDDDADTPDHEVIRYLKTITAWTAAVESLTAPGTLPILPLHAHLFSVPHPIIENLDQHISDFKTSILMQFQDMEDESAIINVGLEQRLKPRGVRHATLHAEALTMALASCFSSPGGVEDIENMFKISKNCEQILYKVFDTPESRIAVSKKCCWSCWRLYCHWNPQESVTPKTASSPEPGPNIALLGSHSTIYPWCPPPVGLPVVFLESMDKELEEILVRVLKDTTEWEGRKSGQTSPQSTAGDVQDLDEWDPL